MNQIKTESPFVIVVDTREQTPWTFDGIRAGASEGHSSIEVRAVVAGLDAGDYSIIGRESEIRIERKSAGDLFGTLTTGRDRFERELERLARFPFSAIVVEAEFSCLVLSPPSRMQPRSFVGSVVALSQRFPSRWYFAGSRAFAEGLAFRLLERWYRDRVEGAASKQKRKAVAL